MKIFDLGHRVLNRIETRLKKKKVIDDLKIYKSKMDEDIHPFKKFPMKVIGDMSANPHEFFNHYDSYSLWLAKKLRISNRSKKILDVGNLKVTNALLSLDNEVTSLVLMDCEDKVSDVNYIVQDISKPLKFKDNTFDVFSSLASLHLVGLGRYGDELNPNTLINFISELDRILKKNSELIFSISYGKDSLLFNGGWQFSMNTLKNLFNKWELIDWLVDNNSSHVVKDYQERFTKDLSLDGWEEGEYRVIFLHFRR